MLFKQVKHNLRQCFRDAPRNMCHGSVSHVYVTMLQAEQSKKATNNNNKHKWQSGTIQRLKIPEITNKSSKSRFTFNNNGNSSNNKLQSIRAIVNCITRIVNSLSLINLWFPLPFACVSQFANYLYLALSKSVAHCISNHVDYRKGITCFHSDIKNFSAESF